MPSPPRPLDELRPRLPLALDPATSSSAAGGGARFRRGLGVSGGGGELSLFKGGAGAEEGDGGGGGAGWMTLAPGGFGAVVPANTVANVGSADGFRGGKFVVGGGDGGALGNRDDDATSSAR